VLPDGTLVSTNIGSHGGSTLLVGPNGRAACNCPQTTFLAPADASPSGAIDSFTGDVVDFQFVNGNLARNMGRGDPYFRFDLSFIKSFRVVPGHEQMRLEFKLDAFNIFNHTNFLGFNGNNDLNVLPISADSNCRLCLNAQTGRYIGADGRVLTVQDLRNGRVSRDVQNGVFGGLGDPTSTDIARTLQLSVRFRW
jgi:hypothetical protein